MTLIGQNPVSHLLDGMVKCRDCGTPMETVGESFNEAPRYVCATKNEGCNTPDIKAEPLNRLVVRRGIHAFLNQENTGKVLTIVLEEAMKQESEDLRAMLDLAPARPSSDEEASPHGEVQEPTVIGIYPETMATEMPEMGMSVVYAATASRKVEEYSLNPDTYLRPSNLQTTKAIIEALISEILVGPDSATIRYRLPVHPGGWPESRTSEEVHTK